MSAVVGDGGRTGLSGADTPSVQRVLEQLRALAEVIRSSHSRRWMECELTMAQLKTLFLVAQQPDRPVGAVAEQLGVSEATASHLVDRLVRAELVERAPDPHDRRRALCRLTAAGQTLYEELDSMGPQRFRQWLQQLQPQDLQALSQGLEALLAVARAALVVAVPPAAGG